MLGDNRANSCDSRTWGSVPRASLIGPVIFTYWPPNRLSYHRAGLARRAQTRSITAAMAWPKPMHIVASP